MFVLFWCAEGSVICSTTSCVVSKVKNTQADISLLDEGQTGGTLEQHPTGYLHPRGVKLKSSEAVALLEQLAFGPSHYESAAKIISHTDAVTTLHNNIRLSPSKINRFRSVPKSKPHSPACPLRAQESVGWTPT